MSRFDPTGVFIQTNADELTLRLRGTVPDVKYLVMVRSNEPYAQWLPFTYAIVVTNNEPGLIRISLKSGEADGIAVMEQTRLQHISARALCQMQFTAGSGEDADGDGLPDIYEVMATKTDRTVRIRERPDYWRVTKTWPETAGRRWENIGGVPAPLCRTIHLPQSNSPSRRSWTQ